MDLHEDCSLVGIALVLATLVNKKSLSRQTQKVNLYLQQPHESPSPPGLFMREGPLKRS